MIKIYVYTAFNGYAWHGCDEQTANDLRSFMEATGTLPKGSSDRPPYGGAVRCVIGGETGTGVYRYLVRERGDAFGRDSMYLSFAFVPTSDGRVDFAKLLECQEMSVPRPGEPEMITVDASRFPLEGEAAIPENARGVWWTHPTSFKLTRDAVNEVARLFFLPESHLGLLRAVFEEGEGGFSAQVEYSVFRQVEEFERRHREVDQHPGSSECAKSFSEALDALNQRAKALGGFEGLKKFAETAGSRGSEVAERERMKSEVLAEVQRADAAAREFTVNCTDWPSCPTQVGVTVLERALAALDAAALKAASVIAVDDSLKKVVTDAHARLAELVFRVRQFNTQVLGPLNDMASDLRPAMLRLLMSRSVDPGPFFKGLAEWARRQFEGGRNSRSRRPDESASRRPPERSPSKGPSIIPLIISFVCGAVLSLLVIWFIQRKPSADQEQVAPAVVAEGEPERHSPPAKPPQENPQPAAEKKTDAVPVEASAPANGAETVSVAPRNDDSPARTGAPLPEGETGTPVRVSVPVTQNANTNAPTPQVVEERNKPEEKDDARTKETESEQPTPTVPQPAEVTTQPATPPKGQKEGPKKKGVKVPGSASGKDLKK